VGFEGRSIETLGPGSLLGPFCFAVMALLGPIRPQRFVDEQRGQLHALSIDA
jgi:hypothetical protein